MKALVLEKTKKMAVRDFSIHEQLGPHDVRVKPLRVGICGSDIHYYLHGKIGDFTVTEPMVLGHEASGIVTEIGKEVTRLAVGDRVCMEPGIPSPDSPEFLEGMYNLDPSVAFWATPPVHGCLRETIVHPEQFTYKLPKTVSLEEGALVEPLAIGVYAAKKAYIVPGDSALVIGAGTIGIVTALAALASGCSSVYISDISEDKLEFVKRHYGDKFIPLNAGKDDIRREIAKTHPRGVNVVFEASGSPEAIAALPSYTSPGGRVVLVGMPNEPAPIDIVALEVKEINISSVFRYANVFDRAIEFIASGQINVKPLHTHTFPFNEAAEALTFASGMPADAVKVMISLE